MINKHRTPAIDKKKLPTPIVTPQNAVKANNSIAKIEKLKNEKTDTANKTQNDSKTLTPKDLVGKLGVNEKAIRIFLRKHYPQTHEKNQPWSITTELAKQIEKDFKNQTKAKEIEKKQQIEQDLKGGSELEKAKVTGESSNKNESSEANVVLKGAL